MESKNQERRKKFSKDALRTVAVFIGVAFLEIALAASYLYAFHAPSANQVPIAVVGQPEKVSSLIELINTKSNGAYKASRFDTESDAVSSLKNQEVYAIYLPDFPSSRVTIASVNSATLAQSIPVSLNVIDESYQKQARQTLTQSQSPAAAKLSAASIETPQVNDIAPLPAGDTKGLGLFYTAFSFVFGGYLVAVALNLLKSKNDFNHRNAISRTLGFALYSFICSLIIVYIAAYRVHIIPETSYWATVGIGTLTTFGVSMLASSIISLLGIIGTGLIIFLFVVMGTPASGGPMAVILTGNGPWHWLAPFLPTGASLDAIRQSVYFGSDNIMKHLWTLIIYAVIGLVVLLTIGIRNSTVSPFDGGITEEDSVN